MKRRAREASTVNQTRQPSTSASTKSAQVDGSYSDHFANPAHRAVVAVLPNTAYRIGGAAALAAHELGMAPEVAERLRLQVATSAMEIVGMILDEAEITSPPGTTTWHDVAMFDPARVSVVDWSKVEEA